MHAILQRRLKSHRDWENVWLTPSSVPAIIRDLNTLEAPKAASQFEGLTHYIAGHLSREGFRLFRNGGLPLIERREGPLIEELLIRQGPHAIEGAYVPVTLQIHICHQGLREIRSRYWSAAGLPPIVMASGNSGLLQREPTYDIWNAASGEALPQIIQFLDTDVLHYIETMESPSLFYRALFEEGAPMIDACTALEYLLCEFGRGEARRYLNDKVLTTPEQRSGFQVVFEAVKETPRLAFRHGNLLRNVAVIAHAYDLQRRG